MSPAYFPASYIRDFFAPSLAKMELISTMKAHFAGLYRGEAANSPRLVLELGQKAALGAMLASVHNETLIGGKIVCVLPQNAARGMNPHQGVVVVFSAVDGSPIGLFDATEITAYRTAALGAAATDTLSRPDAATLTVVGSGYQAYLHAVFIAQVRSLKEVRIFGRTKEKTFALQKKLAVELPAYIAVVDDLPAAVASSDMLCLCTAALAPYISTRQLPSGMHVNAVGACRPGMREIEVLPRSELRIFVDDIERCREEAQELDGPFTRPAIWPSPVAIGGIFSETISGRRNQQDITLFKSVGVGLQDITTAALILGLGLGQKRSEHGPSHSAATS